MNFAENLQRLRQAKKLSRKEVAKIIGVNEITIGYYERGERIPNIEILAQLADLFDVSADELLGRFYSKSFEPPNEAKKFWEGLKIHVSIHPDDSVSLTLPAIAQEPTIDNEGKIAFSKIVNDVEVTFKNLPAFCLFTNNVKQKVSDATLAQSKEIGMNEIKELYKQSHEQKSISA